MEVLILGLSFEKVRGCYGDMDWFIFFVIDNENNGINVCEG